jgi:hypothetical protein
MRTWVPHAIGARDGRGKGGLSWRTYHLGHVEHPFYLEFKVNVI